VGDGVHDDWPGPPTAPLPHNDVWLWHRLDLRYDAWVTIQEMYRNQRRLMHRRLVPKQFKETYINQCLRRVSNPLYVEIGVRNGDSLRAVHAPRKIGIDPGQYPGMSSLRDGEEFYNKTSDNFFSEDANGLFANSRIDVALIDGLHEYEQALRDLLNLERYMAREGVIVLDDFNPATAELAGEPTGGAWNGDVWKIAAYIRAERPDLKLITIDADQGVGLVTRLSVDAEWPRDEAIRKYKHLDYNYLAENRRELLGLVPRAPINVLLE